MLNYIMESVENSYMPVVSGDAWENRILM